MVWKLYTSLLFHVRIYYIPCRSSVHPTWVGCMLIGFLSLLRVCLLYEPLNFILGFINTDSLNVCVFSIGVAIAAECIFSITSYVFRLQLWTVLKRCGLRFQLWTCSVLILTILSVLNAVSLFFKVRDLWVQHMFVTIQILHCIPSLLLITHNITQGIISVVCKV